MSLFHWVLGSFFMAILFLFSLVDEPEHSIKVPTPPQILIDPEETLQELNHQISGKSARLKILMEKINKIEKAISELNFKRKDIKIKYNDVLNNLRSSLTKCETECISLNSDIDKMMEKRQKMNAKLLEAEIQVPLSVSNSESHWL